MPTEKKVQAVEILKELLSRSTVTIVTDYRGITASEITKLRRHLDQSKVEYRVVKNALARLAAEKAGKQGLLSLLEGPTAIALGYDEVTIPAKVLSDYLRASKTSLRIRGGLVQERVLGPEEVLALATLPSKENLIAWMLAGLQAPLINLVNVLSFPMRDFLGILQARVRQLQGG